MSSLIFNGLRLEAQRATVFGVPLSGGKCRSFSNTLRREVSFPLPNARAHSFHSHIVASQRQSLNGHHRCIRRFPSAGTAAAVSTSPVSIRATLSSADSGLTKSPRSLRYMSSTSSFGGDLNPILPGNILRSPLPDLELDTDLPVHQVVFDACDKYKDRLAVVCGALYSKNPFLELHFRGYDPLGFQTTIYVVCYSSKQMIANITT